MASRRTLSAAVDIRRPLPVVYEHFVWFVLSDIDDISPQDMDRVMERLQEWHTTSFDAGYGRFTFVADERIEFRLDRCEGSANARSYVPAG